MEQTDKPLSGELIQQHLVSAALGAHPSVDSQRSADGVVESCCRRELVGVCGGTRWAGLATADDLGFEVADGPPPSATRRPSWHRRSWSGSVRSAVP